MDCFIKKIWQGRGEEVHDQFVRFGKGRFENRAVLNLWKTGKIKLRGSFEWANDFVDFVSGLGDVEFFGIILSKQEIDNVLTNNVKFDKANKKGLYVYEIGEISSNIIKEIKDKAYSMLLDGEGEGVVLKIKKRLPKPGKSGEGKVNDKFCQLELDLKYWPQVKEAFMLPECKKCKVSHVFEINEIIMPEGEKDFAKMREVAKRKGKVIRKVEVGGQIKKEEREFVA